MLFSAVGLLLILHLSQQPSTKLGILLVLVAALSWSLCNLIVKVNKPEDMVAFIVWSSLFSIPILLLMTLRFEGPGPLYNLVSDFTWGAGFSIVFQCYITTIIGYRVWNNLMKKYPASLVAPLSLMVPVSGLLTSYLFFDERLSLGQGIAIGLVFIGIAIFVNSSGLHQRLISSGVRSTPS